MIILLLFIVVSILFDYIVIEIFHKPIKKEGHAVRWIIRATITSLLIIMDTAHPLWQTIPTYTITFWFLFDTGLNGMRGKSIIHLGDSFLDQLQKNYPNEFVWFVWKAIAFIGLFGGYYFNG
jgi:hypothetical protein